MQVWKFGGTSTGTPENMKSIRRLVNDDPNRKIIVLSALSGTTNALIAMGEARKSLGAAEAVRLLDQLKTHYIAYIQDFFDQEEGHQIGLEIIEKEFDFIKDLLNKKSFGEKEDKILVAQGEILSTQFLHAYMQQMQDSVAIISALDFMRIDEDKEPLFSEIEKKLHEILVDKSDIKTIITQGFICLNQNDEVDNLKRGGSDYTASLIGGAVTASEIQIWTDIDGLHNNDPRIVKNTFPVRHLTFEEAAELAYFGAKILHPSTITPAKMRGVPVRLKNTMNPLKSGTLISESVSEDAEITAIAAKDGITAIYIHSTRMLNAYGFLRKVFDVFEKYKTPVDMITTAEVSVAVTIDNSDYLDEISAELSQFAELEEHDRNQTIICVVGQFIADRPGVAIKILEALRNIPVRMISYGASEHNVSILVDTRDKIPALNALNEGLFKHNKN